MSSNFNNAKIINVYYNKGDRKPYDVNGKPIAYIGQESIGATEATIIRFYLGEDLDSSTAVIVTKRPDGERRLDLCAKEGNGATSYYEVTLNAWYGAVKGKATLAFKVYNGDVEFDDVENPTEIISVEGRIVVSDIFNLEIAYAPEADLTVPPDDTEPYQDWFLALSTKLDKADSITVAGALPTLTGDVYDDRYFYVENEGVGRLYYINGSSAIEVVFQVGTLKLTPTGNGDITADTGKLSWNQPNGTAQLGLYNDVNIGLGEDVMYYGKASATITKGQVIQFGGYQGDHILMKPAVPSEINANPKLILGIAKQAITSGDFGYVAHFGKIEGYDSGAFAVGSLLWFNSGSGSNGLLTATQPTAPNAKILMAALIKAETSGAANNGVLQVRIDIEPKLEELQNVLITSATNGNVLSYDGTKWVNSTRLTTAESDIDALEGRMTTEEGNVDSLEGRMTTAEGDIDDIEDGTTIVPKALADQNGNVINTTYLTQSSASATYIPLSQKGVANGVTPLGSNGKVPSIYLSGEQDDLAEFADLASFPAVGETDILYVALDTNKLYRWSGSAYVVISETLAIGTTNTTAFPGDRGLALETLTDNIVDGDQALALKNQVIRNTVVGTSPLVVNSIASTTANLTEFQVNGTKVLEVTPNGGLTQNGTRLFHQTGGNTNTFFGISVSNTTLTGTNNTGIGRQSLGSLTTGEFNTAVGRASGFSLTNAFFNTFIGYDAGLNASQLITASNSTAIGNASFTDKSNQMVFGNASVTEFKFDRNTGAVALLPQVNISSATFPPLSVERTTTQTNTNRFVARVLHTTSADMADGFGSQLTFDIRDSANVINTIGTIGATRSGADGSGRLIFGTTTAGTETEKMTILPNGNVGIGTASPVATLHLGSPTTATYNRVLRVGSGSATDGNGNYIEFPSTTGDNGSRIGGTRTASGGASDLRFETVDGGTSLATERMRILSTGLVGIGTSSPTSLLTVGAAYGGTPNGESRLAVQNSGNVYLTIGAGTTSDSGILFADSGDNDVGVIGYNHNTNHMGFVVNASERLRITSTGNVGIGTTAPATQLHIFGADPIFTIQDSETTSSSTNVRLRLAESGVSNVVNEYVDLRKNGDDFQVDIYNGATTITPFVVKYAGLVGINETSFTTNVAQLVVKSGATTRIPLIVDTIASHATQIQEWRKNTTLTSFIDVDGRYRGIGIASLTFSNANMSLSDNGAVISRNIADSNPALIVNLTNATSTGHIQVWQSETNAKAHITRTGIFVGQSRPTRTDITANATLALADEGKVLRVNPVTAADNITVTVPPNSGVGSVAFPIDTEIAIVRYNSGTVTIVAGSGVTIRSKNSETKISGQYGSVALKKIGDDEWVLVGSLEA
jgi:hypothetical protein